MNLPMHEAHCQRFLCICPDCDEQVPKDHLEEHQQEQHAPVSNMFNFKRYFLCLLLYAIIFFLC